MSEAFLIKDLFVRTSYYQEPERTEIQTDEEDWERLRCQALVLLEINTRGEARRLDLQDSFTIILIYR